MVSEVSALGANDATASVQWSKPSPQAGDTVTLTFRFQSKIQDQLYLYGIGIHTDWMPPEKLAGPQYSTPVTIAGMGSYVSDPYTFSIPETLSPEGHTYYVGIYAYDTAGNEIIWDSQKFTIGNTLTQTATATAEPPEAPSNLMLYLAVIAGAVVIVVVLVILLMMRKGKHATPTTSSTQPPTNQPQPPPTPEDKNSESPEDFNI
jgi:hypothetical protein